MTRPTRPIRSASLTIDHDDTEAITYADLSAQRERARLQSIAVCEALGLDPGATVGVRVDFDAKGRATVQWDGVRRLDHDQTTALLAAIGDVL